MVTFLKHTKTSEMAFFHVCYFDAFWRQTLKVAGSVHRSMFYGWRKFGCRSAKGTWPTGVWKRHLRIGNCCMRPRGEVPPDFTPPCGDFVLQLAFGLKWAHSKFGMKPWNPGGATVENVVFSLFSSCLELALFHVYIFVAFKCIQVKVGRLVLWSMLYNSVKHQGHRMKVTWLIGAWRPDVRRRICHPWISPPGRRFRTPASCCFQMASYQIGVQTVTTEGSYSGKSVFSFLRMRNAEFLFFSCPGGRWRVSRIIVAVTTVLSKSRRFASSLVVFLHVSNVDSRWEPP